MKKNYILVSLTIASLGFLAFERSGDVKLEKFQSAHKFSAGPPAAQTGAPGETNCTSCHSGSAQSGIGENVLTVADGFTPVSTYLPGVTYNVLLQKTSNPAKKGFQATALDNTATMAGSFTGQGVGGTAVISSGGRDYVSHTLASNTSSTSTWIWEWTAPATNVGDVTFFVASNSANNNGANSGDVIYLSTHTISIDPSAGISESTVEETNFEAGYAASSNKVIVDFPSLVAGDMFVNLVDMNGKSVFTQRLGTALIGDNHQEVSLPESLNNGIYAVHYFVGNKAMTAKIMIQK